MKAKLEECPKCGVYRKEFKNGYLIFYNRSGEEIGRTQVIGYGEKKTKEGKEGKALEGREQRHDIHEERQANCS
jgi:hypothetical protein